MAGGDERRYFGDAEVLLTHVHHQVRELLERKPVSPRTATLLVLPSYVVAVVAVLLIANFGWNDNGGIYSFLYFFFGVLPLLISLSWALAQRKSYRGYQDGRKRAEVDMVQLFPIAREVGGDVAREHVLLFGELIGNAEKYVSAREFLHRRDHEGFPDE